MAKTTKDQPSLQLTGDTTAEVGKVECLGLIFENEEARRAHFAEQLRKKLKDPAFRKQDGFPQGADEDILRMSDPPFYTACPNPFLEDFVRCCGRPYDPAEPYQREPFAVDTSVGKTDALYKAHGYHTKVPHLAIVPSILHYTKPGDIVLDGFAGSGMTGVAAQWCGVAPAEYRKLLEMEWKKAGRAKPEWGARRAILNDLGPAATFIAVGYNLPFDVKVFAREAERILDEVGKELGWMYETRHKDGRIGRINYTVWSEVFSCPECAGEVVFLEQALDKKTKRTKEHFKCASCKAELTKEKLERRMQSVFDTTLQRTLQLQQRVGVLVNYRVDGLEFEKPIDEHDRAVLEKVSRRGVPTFFPRNRMMNCPDDEVRWGDNWRAGTASFSYVHQLFLNRPAHALSALVLHADKVADAGVRHALVYFLEQAIWGMSTLARYAPTHYSQVNQYMNGLLRVLSQHAECSPDYILRGKLRRLVSVFSALQGRRPNGTYIGTGDSARLLLPDASCDYIFTDPPFGDNFAYAELNFILESFHRVFTESRPEAIVSEHQRKELREYQTLMFRCFQEYFRVLKPGRWMTVVFSKSETAVWRAIQESLSSAGFVVADVRILDKQQGSFNQVKGTTPKQDLVISAYKPTESLAKKFALGESSEAGAWAFVGEHLRNVPVFVPSADKGETVAERTVQMLHDRMIAFHVQRGLAVPVSGPEFETGLRKRFAEREGMFFLPHQVAEYDRKRTTVTELKQLDLFVTDESSAIRWLRQQLDIKPRTLQDLTPEFTRHLQAWERHEITVELRDLLAQNFICYDGGGPVPPQIHTYLSSNYKDLRNLSKSDPALVRRAKGRWYVPDPAQAIDIEKLRQAALLREFQEYVQNPTRRMKVFRTEAVRAGFKAAYDARDYDLIVRVAEKLPESVLREDERLLMYHDVASTRLGR